VQFASHLLGDAAATLHITFSSQAHTFKDRGSDIEAVIDGLLSESEFQRAWYLASARRL
jgi:hypothetical protein